MFGGHSLDIVVECKSSAAHPWVLFRSGARPPDGFTDLMVTRHVQGDGRGARHLRPGRSVGVDCPLLYSDDVTTVYAAKAAGEKVDTVYGAVSQVLAAATAVADAAETEMSGRQESTLVVVIPVVVTAAPLFAVRLGGDGAFLRERVSRALLLHQAGASAGPKPSAVWLWDAAALDDLADAAVATGNGMTTG